MPFEKFSLSNRIHQFAKDLLALALSPRHETKTNSKSALDNFDRGLGKLNNIPKSEFSIKME